MIKFMCRLIESVKIIDGRACNLEYHTHRMNQSRKALFRLSSPIDLETYLTVPEWAGQGLYKCRILYKHDLENIEFIPYQRRSVKTLKLVYADHVDYRYKYADRSELNMLFEAREDCDDILIIKNGRVTDTFYGNIIFFDGEQWITPLQPLLKGIQRQKLLDQHYIAARNIVAKDISSFSCFKVINALNEFHTSPVLAVQYIME